MRNNWTEEELQFIKDNYKIKTDKEISNILVRHSELSIANKRRRMGLYHDRFKYSFKDVIDEFSKKNYILVSDENDFFNAAKNTLKYICPKHLEKGIQTISFGHLKSGRGCYWCGREITESAHRTGFSDNKIQEDKQLCQKKGFEYIDTIYNNGKICIKFICNEHCEVGEQLMARGNMKRENITGCKYCFDNKKFKFSKGEKRIQNYLDEHKIKFVNQYIFDDCKDCTYLPFDFYLLDKNTVIEYDGQHHFRPVNFNGVDDEKALNNYNTTIYHDGIKNNYCKNNNIEIIRIPYWEYNNIENILDEKIA